VKEKKKHLRVHLATTKKKEAKNRWQVVHDDKLGKRERLLLTAIFPQGFCSVFVYF